MREFKIAQTTEGSYSINGLNFTHQDQERNSMRAPASISKHPIHPILIVFPVGLWIFSLVCDLIRLAGASQDA